MPFFETKKQGFEPRARGGAKVMAKSETKRDRSPGKFDNYKDCSNYVFTFNDIDIN